MRQNWKRVGYQQILFQSDTPTQLTLELTMNSVGDMFASAQKWRKISPCQPAAEQLAPAAFRDALTGLPNRVFLIDRLGQAIALSKWQPDYQFALLILDLDRFKILNDSLGHRVGDQLLIAVAHRLQACLNQTKSKPQSFRHAVMRLGGDEFAILLEGIQEASQATQVAEQIQQALSLPFHLGEHEIFTSASIGITLSIVGYEQQEDCLRDVDIAMYRAKALHGADYQVFARHMHLQVLQRLHLENDLRRTLTSAESEGKESSFKPKIEQRRRQSPRRTQPSLLSTDLLLHYQPIVSIATGQLQGFEALVRWQHPQRGLISPEEFIPVAEETKLILPLGAWVLREACHQMRRWQLAYPHIALTISVNLSSKQLMQPDLIDQIDKILRETGLEGRYLKLEITESTMIESEETATRVLQQLRQRQIGLYLDDFGTGYSSLGRLHRLPIDTLKIDRSFIKGIAVNNGDEKMVVLILTLAQHLGLEVITEGIETAQQLAKLQELQCQYGQGNFFSQPLDSRAAEALIQTCV